jgi:dolichol-phosphate mannosyltransferase|tara:strand:+ start:10076 stop:10831 length:756 start_codon:yes stop_codon:yes gene_type:complete
LKLTGESSNTNEETRPLEVAIVVPTYNEAETLPVLIAQVRDQNIEGLGFVIVDDGSPDGTGDIADAIADEYPGVFIVLHREGKQGLGSAYRAGFQTALDAGAERIVEMDADLSHPPEVLNGLICELDHAHVAVASRYVSGGGVDPDWSWGRQQISYWGNVGIRMILGLKVKDATAGFKGFRRKTLESIGIDRLRLSGFGFQAEVAYRCQKAGMNVVEHPYVFMERTAGKSKMSLGIVVEAFFQLSWLRIRG